MPEIDDFVEEVSEDARDAAYVAACAGLGVAKMGETAYRAVKTFEHKALGDEEVAVRIALTNSIEDATEELADKLDVSEKVKAVGNRAEVVGEFVGGVGMAMAAAALAPEGVGAIAAGAGLGALAALDVSGELLENAAADGVITNMETVEAAGGGIGMAALGVAIGGVTETVIGEIETEVTAAGATAEDVMQATEEVIAAEAAESATEGTGRAIAKTVADEGSEAVIENAAEKAGKETLSSAIEKAAENASKSMIEKTGFNRPE